MKRILLSFSVLVFATCGALAQWQVPNHSVPVGRGAGITGFKSAGPCTNEQFLTWGGVTTDPSCTSLASLLLSPPPIGGTTPNTIAATNLSATPASGDALTITTPSTNSRGFVVTQNPAGVTAPAVLDGKYPFNYISIPTDNLSAANKLLPALMVDQHVGGSAFQGGRAAILGSISLDAAGNASNPNGDITASGFYANANANDTNVAYSYFAQNLITTIQPSVPNVNNAVGNEIDMITWSQPLSRVALSITDSSGIGGVTSYRGSANDAAIIIAAQPASGGGNVATFEYGLLFSNYNGAFAFDSTSTLIGATGTNTAKTAIDVSSWTFTDFAFKSANATISGAGAISAASLALTTPLPRASGGTQVSTGAAVKVASQVFTTTGTYTPTTGMLYATIECVGAGGGGGGVVGSLGNSLAGGGGGAGGYSRITVSAATIGASKAVTIGAAGVGASGIAGTAGGDTSLGSICVGKGGSGGNYNDLSTGFGEGGIGGVAGTGTVLGDGNGGGGGLSASIITVLALGGKGGATLFGGGGTGVLAASTFAIPGNAGTGFGSGGGGGAIDNAASNIEGGNGRPGYVVVTEYLNQ